MNRQRRPLAPGMFRGRLGWTWNHFPRVLPDGVPDRAAVVVLEVLPDSREFEVMNEDGDRWRLDWDVVTFPGTYTFPDSRREYTEWHPRVRAMLQGHLDGRLSETVDQPFERQQETAISSLRWQLERSSRTHPLAGVKLPKP